MAESSTETTDTKLYKTGVQRFCDAAAMMFLVHTTSLHEGQTWWRLLTAHRSLSQLTAHNSLLTTYCSQLTAHNSLLTTHCSQLTAHNSLLSQVVVM